MLSAMPRFTHAHAIIILVASALLNLGSYAATTYDLTRSSVDAVVAYRQDNGPALGYYVDTTSQAHVSPPRSHLVGAIGSTLTDKRYCQNLIYRYTLPTLKPGEVIQSFTFTCQITSYRDLSQSDYRLDVYLLDELDPTTTGTSLFYRDSQRAKDPLHEFIGSHLENNGDDIDIVLLDPPVDLSYTVTTGDALTLLQSFYGGDHIPDQPEVSLRFNLDLGSEYNELDGDSLNRYIVNPDITTSGFKITVSEGSAPNFGITSISPDAIVGLPIPGRVPVTINGSGFVDGLEVSATWTGGSATVSSSNVTVLSPTQVYVTLATDVTPDAWTLSVTNPDGQTSNTAGFNVIALGVNGDRVQCTENEVNVRNFPSTSSAPTGSVSAGFQGTIVSGPVTGSGYGWYYINWDNGVSGYTAQNFLTKISGTPPAPTNLEAQAFSGRVELGWSDNSVNESGFKVERRLGDGAWSQIATLSSGTNNTRYYTDNDIATNTTYLYRVRAYNGEGNSPYTNEVNLTTPAGPPGALALSNDPPYWDYSFPAGPAVSLRWTASQDVGAYAVYRNGSVYEAGISGTSYTNELGLNPGQTYSYFVRASNAEGTTDSNTMTVTMPANPGTSTDKVLSGFVRDGVSNQALSNVTVTFGGSSTQTDSSGFYAFSGLHGISATLSVGQAGYDPYSLSINPASNSVKNIYLTPDYTASSGSLSGFVRDKATGTAQPNVTVSLTGGLTTVSDGSGYYSFSSLTPASYTINVSTSDFSNYNETLSVTGTRSKNILLARNPSSYGGDNPSPKNADPVNTATGNYFSNTIDLRISGPGVPFVFERHYNSQDATDGPLGFGWNHSYNVGLSVIAGGNVIVRWGDSREDAYVSDGSGGFTTQYGIFDTLIANPDGTYSLEKKNQTVYNFNLSNRLISIVDKNSNTVSLHYTGSNLTSIIDSAGRTITLTNDGNGRITQIADPIGRTVQYTYDASGDLVTSTDPNGNTTNYTYDANHQVLTVVDPRGNTLVSNAYDAEKRVVNSQLDAKGGQTTFVYDEVNRKTTVTQPLGRVTVDHFDTLHRLVQREDALGNSSFYAYDEAGNRTVVTDKRGYNTQYEYDERGNVTAKIDPFGSTTTITYDAENRPLTRTDALGNTTTFEYDSAGNLVKTIDPLAGETRIAYDSIGLPLTVTDPLGRVATTTYDTEGNPATETDALDNTATLTYDGVGRPLTVTDPLSRVTTRAYDANDNLLTATDPLGEIRSYTYDGNDNKLSSTDRRGNSWAYVYDEKDLRTTTTDPLLNETTSGYDALDQRTSVTDARGNTVQFVYDTVGNLITEIDALSEETQHTYDEDGNRITTTDPLGNTTEFVYDKLDRLVQTKDPLGHITTITYDDLSRRTGTTDANGHSTTLEYDALGRLTKVTDAAGGEVTYTYDAVGNRLSMIEPNGNTTTFIYDDLDRLIQKQEPSGGIYQYAYNAVGNRVSQTDPNANTITYSYDANNQLTEITYPSGAPVTFTYDENGSRTAMTDSLGNSTFSYDALNRMTASTDAYGKQIGYSYDEVGHRSTMTYPGSNTVTYGYDAANRMTSVTDWLGGITTYSYDAAGKHITTSNPNGTTAVYTHDAASRLVGLVNAKPDASVICSYSLTLDGVGNHLQSTHNEPLEPHFQAENTAYTYDADNRLTSAGGVAIGYDDNGNMTSHGSDTYSYDFEDRLSETTIDGATYQYAYNGVGNRKEAIAGGETTRYVLDINDSISHVLAETDETGSISNYYIYGRGLTSRIDSSGTAYYHYDVRGSTIALTDESSFVSDSYAYDSFGTILNSSGSNANPFRYVGRYGLLDDGNGLKYVRARYYAPLIGRFITKDPYLGEEDAVQSLHRYVYAQNNPLRLVDVSGFSPCEFESGTFGVFVWEKNNPNVANYVAQRTRLNGRHPTYNEVIADSDAWVLQPAWKTEYHDNGDKDPELKFVNKYDGREAVFTKDFSDKGDYEPYVDPKYAATYNKRTDSLGHLAEDVVPFWDAQKRDGNISIKNNVYLNGYKGADTFYKGANTFGGALGGGYLGGKIYEWGWVD